MRSASALRFSKGCSSLNLLRILVVWEDEQVVCLGMSVQVCFSAVSAISVWTVSDTAPRVRGRDEESDRDRWEACWGCGSYLVMKRAGRMVVVEGRRLTSGSLRSWRRLDQTTGGSGRTAQLAKAGLTR